MPAAKAKGLIWLLAAVLFAAGVAVGLPRLAKHLPWSTERWLGGLVGGPGRAQTCEDHASPDARAALKALVGRLYPAYPDDAEFPITVEVVRGDTVNAYATLGGHVFVIDGLLQKVRSPDELAGVLAHEIEHVRHRHIIQGFATSVFTLAALAVSFPDQAEAGSRLAYLLLTLKFSRGQEAEADVAGLDRLKAARIDARGFEDFFARAEESGESMEILSSHPANESRAALAAKYRGYPAAPALDARQWSALQAICK